MASTYTTNLRLTKQGDGENPNSWGQILNDGVISLADSAIAGYTTVSIGSAATVTLTENQGSNDQARSAFLEFKGSVGGAYTSIFVLIPNNSKGYVVRNSVSYNNTGSDAVIMRVAGNAGVTIASGSNKFVITDGTSVYNVTNDTFSNITIEGNADIQGTLSVSGAATFKSTVTVEGAGTFKGDVSVSGNTRIGGTVTVAGAVSLASTLSVGGATNLASTVTVVGAAALKSTVTVGGAANFGSTVTVEGATNLASTVTVVGAGTFKSNVSVSGNMNIAGNTSIGGTVTIVGANVQAANAKVCASAFYGDGTNLTGLLPPGIVLPYGASASPTGYLLCNGAAVSRSTYSSLFAVVSSLYGNGDGSSTFNVPDLRGRFIAGWDVSATASSVLTSVTAGMVINTTMANTGGVQAVTLAVAQTPSHNHLVGSNQYSIGDDAGNNLQSGTSVASVSTTSTGGGGAHSNIPPTMILNYIIKT